MAWYPDLARCGYFGEDSAPRLAAVGWLEGEHEFDRGPLGTEFSDRLAELLADPWQPVLFRGRHACSLGTGDHRARPQENQIFAASHSWNLFVPGNGFLFVSPAMIGHYVHVHDYTPPQEYQEAVLACPAMNSMEYFHAIIANGPRVLLQASSAYSTSRLPAGVRRLLAEAAS